MKKKLDLYQTDKGILVEADGEPLTILPVIFPKETIGTGAEPDGSAAVSDGPSSSTPTDDTACQNQSPSTEDEEGDLNPQSSNPGGGDAAHQEGETIPGAIVYGFSDWHPTVINTRLREPKGNWAVLHNIAENQKSVNVPANAYVEDGVLHLAVSRQGARYGSTEKAFSSATVQSAKRCFGLGRTTVVANLPKSGKMCKFSIWLTTSPFHDRFDSVSHINMQSIEIDAVEWTEADTGDYNTSRGMWWWHENKESVSDNRLPHINLEKKESVSGGSWWWGGKGWYQWAMYPICRNGNRLKGTNLKYYFVTNTERGKSVASADLEWIREDGVTGKGLDGNKYFTASPTDAKGGGADKSAFFDGKTPISGWHEWTIVVEREYIALECDGQEYWRSKEKMELPEDLGFNLIFAASLTNEKFQGECAMQVREVRYAPKLK